MRTISLLLVMFPAVLFAQAEPEDAVARTISATIIQGFNLSDVADQAAERASGQVWYQLSHSLKGEVPTMDQYREVMNRLNAVMQSSVTRPEVVEGELAAMLEYNLNAQELKQLDAFLKSSAGQKTLPLLLNLDEIVVNGTVDEDSPDLAEIIDEVTGAANSEKRLVKRTMADLRSLATATEAYAVDNNRYPSSLDLEGLAHEISPIYIRTVPQTDAWGGKFVYVMFSDGQRYRFISGGADKAVDLASRNLAFDETQGPVLTTDPSADIIYENGTFLQFPQWISEEMTREPW